MHVYAVVENMNTQYSLFMNYMDVEKLLNLYNTPMWCIHTRMNLYTEAYNSMEHSSWDISISLYSSSKLQQSNHIADILHFCICKRKSNVAQNANTTTIYDNNKKPVSCFTLFLIHISFSVHIPKRCLNKFFLFNFRWVSECYNRPTNVMLAKSHNTVES